ncbi:MAG: GFA family protein [Pseudomonadota bacterium]
MRLEGGCYCGDIRYVTEGEPAMKAQCHCRECQYLTGGSPNVFMVMPRDGFRFTAGEPKPFQRSDLESPVTREFCPECGTHLITRTPRMPERVIVKVGSLDDPGAYGKPDVAIFTCDQQPFHLIPDDIPSFDKRPG